VQVAGDVAVLTFNFESWTKFVRYYWNTTEVYRRTDQGWRIIHTHWSIPQKG
jgi:ketosteroid isomerase-like protein